ncbi:MAG TPA: hypothetical protein VEC01_05125 [Noviherbaspirillum sp.]|uniref:hypothetical protein n=1 Tax=Noviherbaspirillum sp. TaxID=1926288 RepID=UPI002D41055A|nr:hypothetical protein [Noviherbaspirillum sp.]HYD94687.1 hypothetical protein [Noviherbaspirillum sp.]
MEKPGIHGQKGMRTVSTDSVEPDGSSFTAARDKRVAQGIDDCSILCGDERIAVAATSAGSVPDTAVYIEVMERVFCGRVLRQDWRITRPLLPFK